MDMDVKVKATMIGAVFLIVSNTRSLTLFALYFEFLYAVHLKYTYIVGRLGSGLDLRLRVSYDQSEMCVYLDTFTMYDYVVLHINFCV